MNAVEKEQRKMVNELIRQAKGSPADTAIRLVFKHGVPGSVNDIMEGDEFKTVTEALRYWHSVDEMRLGFQMPGSKVRSWIYLIHQEPEPTLEDISDYTTDLDDTPIGPVFKSENFRVQTRYAYTGKV